LYETNFTELRAIYARYMFVSGFRGTLPVPHRGILKARPYTRSGCPVSPGCGSRCARTPKTWPPRPRGTTGTPGGTRPAPKPSAPIPYLKHLFRLIRRCGEFFGICGSSLGGVDHYESIFPHVRRRFSWLALQSAARYLMPVPEALKSC
jgi:hypothetical protein